MKKSLGLFFIFSCLVMASSAQWKLGGGVDYHIMQGVNAQIYSNGLGYRVQLSYRKDNFKYGAYFANQKSIAPRRDTTSLDTVFLGQDTLFNGYHLYQPSQIIQAGGFIHMTFIEGRKYEFTGGLDINYFSMRYDRVEYYPGLEESTTSFVEQGMAFGPSLLFDYKLTKRIGLDILLKQSFVIKSGGWQRFANAYAGLNYKF